MPTVADYAVLSDARFDLSTSIGLDSNLGRLTFNRPDNFVQGTNLAKPVLIYQVLPDPECSYEVHINHPFGDSSPEPQRIHDKGTIGGGRWRTVLEAIDGDLFGPGNNSLKFHVTSGRASFADVILMYQVEI